MSWDIDYTIKMSESMDLDIFWFEDVSTPDEILNSSSILDKLMEFFSWR